MAYKPGCVLTSRKVALRSSLDDSRLDVHNSTHYPICKLYCIDSGSALFNDNTVEDPRS